MAVKKIGEIWKKIKNTLFFETYKEILTRKKDFFSVFLLGILMVLSVYFIGKIWNALLIPLKTAAQNRSPGAAMLFLFAVLFYYAVLIAVYSFFKYCELDIIKSSVKESEIKLGGFLWFFGLNVLMAVIVFIISFLILIISERIIFFIFNESYRLFFSLLSLVFLFCTAYVLLGRAHSLFVLGDSIKSIFNFSRIKKYFIIYIEVIILFFIGIYAIKNRNQVHASILMLFLVIIIPFLVTFNEFYFYRITKKIKN